MDSSTRGSITGRGRERAVTGWRRFRTNHGALAGLVCLVIVAAATAGARLLVSGDPWAIVAPPFLPPTWEYPLGTDTLGRSVLAGIVHGARVSLLIGLAAAGISTAIGVLIGAIAAYHGGWVDDL